MTLKSQTEIAKMYAAGRVIVSAFELIRSALKPGMRTIALDTLVDEHIRAHGGEPSFKNYRGFPRSICASLNETVVHGIPGERVIMDGDIVSVDIGVKLDGFHADAARTFAVGNVSEDVLRLIRVTEKCFFDGIMHARPGKRIGDISSAVQSTAEGAGYSVVRELIGHGIGRSLHEPPDVPNFGRKGHGMRLERGLTIAVEPMINLGCKEVLQLDDGWTVVTRDGLPSAHYENTIAITDGEPMILTL